MASVQEILAQDQALKKKKGLVPHEEATAAATPKEGTGETVIEAEVPLVDEGTEEGGVMLSLLDAIAGPVRGVVSAVENAGENASQLFEDATGIPMGRPAFAEQMRDPGDRFVTFLTLEEERVRVERHPEFIDPVFGVPGREDNFLGKPSTFAGELTKSTAQFLFGFLTFKGALGAAGAGTAVSTVGAGMLADGMAFNVHEHRLSNLVQEFPALENPVTEYLAADASDTAAEATLKAVLEGAGLGSLTSGTLLLIKHLRHAKSLKTNKQRDEYMDKVEPEVREAVQKELDVWRDQDFGLYARQKREAARAEAAKRPPVDTVRLRTLLSERRAGDDVIGDPGVFNWSKMDSQAEVEQVWQGLVQEMKGTVGRWTKEGTYTLKDMHGDAVRQLSDMVDGDEQLFMRGLEISAQNAEDQVTYLLSGKMMAQSLAMEVDRLAKAFEMGDDVKGEFLQRVTQLSELVSNLKDIQRGAARVTAAGRIKTADIGDPELLKKILEENGGEGGVGVLANRVRSMLGDPKGVIRVASHSESRLGRLARVANEIYINSLLSAPTTHLVNASSNAVKMIVNPIEKIVGGAMMRDMDVTDEGMKQLLHLLTSIPQSLRFGYKAFRQANNVLDPNVRQVEDFSHAISMEGKSWMAYSVNAIGTIVRLPTRLLLTSDEVFKQMSYRSALRAKLETKALSVIPGNTKADRVARAKWTEEKFKAGFGPDGKGLDVGARQEAREATFTQELTDSQRGGATKAVGEIQKLANKVPVLRQVLPFIRTPWNLVTDVAVRTPGIAHLSPSVRAALNSPDPVIKAKAKGKLAVGATLWSSAAAFALEGKITGSGPADPKVRARWVAAGWRPYSLVTTNENGEREYISYSRMDPFGMFLAQAANWNEISANLTIEENEEIAVALLVSSMDTLSNKTFLQGLYNVMGGLAEADRKGEAMLRRHLAGYAPGLLRQAANVSDDVFGTDFGDTTIRHQNGSIIDGFKAKIPGWSKDLPARYDIITGKPLEYDRGDTEWFGSVSPFVRNTEEFDPVLQELRRINLSFSDLPRRDGEYEFDKEQYERLQRLAHKPIEGEPSLYDRLMEEIGKDYYWSLPDSDGGFKAEGTKTKQSRLAEIVDKYKARAKKVLMRSDADYNMYFKDSRKVARKMQRNPDQASSIVKKFRDLLRARRSDPTLILDPKNL